MCSFAERAGRCSILSVWVTSAARPVERVGVTLRARERCLAPHRVPAEQALVRAVVGLHLDLDPGIHRRFRHVCNVRQEGALNGGMSFSYALTLEMRKMKIMRCMHTN